MGDLFLKVLNMSYGASIVILIVLLLRVFLKKTPKIYSYVLWSVVLLRLMLPISIESNFSLIPNTNFSVENLGTQSSNKETNVDFIQQPSTNVQITQTNVDDQTNTKELNTNKANINSNVLSGSGETQNIKPNMTNQVLFWLSCIWVTGFVILLGYGVITLVMFKSRLYNVQLYKENIYFADNISTAFVLGIISPKIYIPRNLTESELEYILLHEQKHIKRWDYSIKFVSYIAVCIHWFNPLVWLAYFKSTEDMEMSCDESVIKELGSDIKQDYSNSLLTFATKEYAVSMPLAFGEVSVKSRIKNVLNYKSVSGKVGIVLLILTALVATVLSLNPVSNTTLSKVNSENFDNVLLADSMENIDNTKYVSIVFGEYGSPSSREVQLPSEAKAKVVTFLHRIELQGKAKNYTKTDDEFILSLVGNYEGSDETVIENYCFSSDFTIMYVDKFEGTTDAYNVLNPTDIKFFFESTYASTEYSIDDDNKAPVDISEVVLDYEELYNAKVTSVINENKEDIINLLNMTPLGQTTEGESVELIRLLNNTGGVDGITWNVRKPYEFDHNKELSESILLIFILIDGIDYVEVNIDGVIEKFGATFYRERTNSTFGVDDIQVYGESPKTLESFMEEVYKIDDKILISSSSQRSKVETDLPEDFIVEEAVAEKYYVREHGKVNNEDVMTKFVNDVNDVNVKKALVRTINYTQEGDPIITTFVYNYNAINVFIDNTRDKFAGSIESEPKSYDANIVEYHDSETVGGKTYYYVTNLNEITKEDFVNGFDGVLLYYIEEE